MRMIIITLLVEASECSLRRFD